MSHDIRKFFGGGTKTSRPIPNDSRIEKAFKPKTPEKKVQEKRPQDKPLPKESLAGKSNGAPKKETFGSNKRLRTFSSSSEEELIFPTRTVQHVEVKEKEKVAQKKPAKQPPKVEKVQERKSQPKAKPKEALEKVQERKTKEALEKVEKVQERKPQPKVKPKEAVAVEKVQERKSQPTKPIEQPQPKEKANPKNVVAEKSNGLAKMEKSNPKKRVRLSSSASDEPEVPQKTITYHGITKPVVAEVAVDQKYMKELAKAHEDVRTPAIKPSQVTPKKVNGVSTSTPSAPRTRSASKLRREELLIDVTTPEKNDKRKETGVDLIEEYPSSQATSKSPAKKTSRSPAKKPRMDESTAPKSIQIQTSKSISPQCVPWVEKYRPTNMKQILGQQGDKSCMKKLSQWLRDWPKWHITGEKQKRFSKGAGDDGSVYKAALLSGPPGIGKTTTAEVVCKELGLNFLALNASDARNKKSLEQSVSEFLSSHSIQEFWHGGSSKPHPPSKKELKNVLIMDEVDGMSGNEDRAGIAELIALIKSTRIPIICICNDRYSQKIRSLANHCYDLRFHRPQVTQIRSAILSILFKEKIKLPPMMVDQIIESSGKDIRQVLNHLNFLAATGKGLTNMEDAKNAVLKKENSRKDETVNVFDGIRKLFSASEDLTLNEKTELFFSDYDLVPLFVQENYLNVDPANARTKVDCLETISKAADLMSIGDTIDRQIRTDQNWSLLNQKAMFSTVLPCDLMRGRMHEKINFPSWFGKFSKQNKMKRLAQQLNLHTSSKVSASGTSWAMDYAPVLRQSTTEPLLRSTEGGVSRVLQTMDAYDLTMEDRESILELTKWPDMPDSAADIPSKMKAALTRAYNKHGHKLPYASVEKTTGKKKKGKQAAVKNVDLEEEGVDEEMDMFEDAGETDMNEFM